MIRVALTVLALGALCLPQGLLAQSGLPDPDAIAGQNLRGYSHMFIAYGIAWILVLGWVVSIARRLKQVQKSLEE